MNTFTAPSRKLQLTVLGIASALSVLLVFFRIQYTSSLSFIFLIWNLVLAWIPLVLVMTVQEIEHMKGSKYVIPFLLMGWLAFFPNAPYILTDLYHLTKKPGMPLWFDMVLILSFAWNGLILGLLSLWKVHRFIERRSGSFMGWMIVSATIVVSSFGIYLGRFLRWNSWDILNNPMALFNDIFERIVDPFAHPQTIGVTLSFSLLLATCYSTLYLLFQSARYENQIQTTRQA